MSRRPWTCSCNGWKSQATTVAVCEDILSVLKATRITHRSVGSVNAKIQSIEVQWEEANAWLNESRLFVAYQIGGVDDSIRASVNKLCPAYDLVSSVFRNATSGDEVVIEDESNDGSDREQCSQVVFDKRAAKAEKKVLIEDDERHHRQELFECELGAKRVQADVEIVCAKVLGRQKLLDAGVPSEEVDRVLPPL